MCVRSRVRQCAGLYSTTYVRRSGRRCCACKLMCRCVFAFMLHLARMCVPCIVYVAESQGRKGDRDGARICTLRCGCVRVCIDA